MEFETKAQKACYDKISGWMEKLFIDIPWEKLDGPGFGLFMGSAWVEVNVYPWGDDDAVINVCSTVVSGAKLTNELLQFLLRENDTLRFGAFAINDEGDILFAHTIVGSTCDPQELEASATEVLEIADDYDDQIVARYGGDRALDRSPANE